MPVTVVSYKRALNGLLLANYFPRTTCNKEIDVTTKINFHFRVIVPKAETGSDSLCFVFYPDLELVNHEKSVLKEEWMYSELTEIDFRTELHLPAEASWQIVGTAEIFTEYDDKEQTCDSVINFLDYHINQINDLTLKRYLQSLNTDTGMNIDGQSEKT